MLPQLSYGPVLLRALRRRDARAWVAERLANEQWLRPWESVPIGQSWVSWSERHSVAGFHQLVRQQRQGVRAAQQIPYGVFLDGRLAGQVNVMNVVHGAFNSAHLGYWVSQRVAGRGVMPTAVALLADHAFAAGLHRLEANIRPENTASIRVVQKVGFQPEGRRRRYLAVDGQYRDHDGWVLLAEDLPGGVLAALVAAGRSVR